MKHIFPPVDSDIIYNDGTKDGLDMSQISPNKIKTVVLQEITEEDLENLNYEYSDDESAESAESGASYDEE